MLSLNVVLSLIMQAKRKGKGILSNGKVYTLLMLCISDFSSETELLKCFNNEVIAKEAYRKLERFLSRFLKDGKGYPYELISFNQLKNSLNNTEKMTIYLHKLEYTLDKFIDKNKIGSLVYTMLKLVRQDSDIKEVLYGSDNIDKKELVGGYVHQKRICVEALILGLLYQCHKSPCLSENLTLMHCPDRNTFQVIRYSADAPLELDSDLDIIEIIRTEAQKQTSESYEYPFEFICNGSKTTALPKNNDLFIQGIKGSGKTALLKSLINSDDSAFLYFSLDSYKEEFHSRFSTCPCWIILNILLKYHYQYEYTTYEALSINMNEDVVVKQLSLLNETFETEPIYNKSWTLLLDDMNELPLGLYDVFAKEIMHISKLWKNVRIIVSGRVFPDNKAMDVLDQVRLTGISEGKYSLMKLPMIYNIYRLPDVTAETAGELLDLYFSHWQGNDVIRFLIWFALPLVGKKMLDDWETRELSRAETLQTIDDALKIYIQNDHVYQNHVRVKNIDKKSLLESRQNDEWIDLLIKNTGLLTADEDNTSLLRFTEQFYRDYFAARHIVNAVEIFETGSVGCDDPEEYLSDISLSGMWFNEPDRFPEKYDTYKMLGEVCRERLKAPDNKDFYVKNTLDRFLDICRGLKGGYSVENVIIVKKIIHQNIICHTDFSYLNLPLQLPGDTLFSIDGEYPSNFYKCRVYRISESDNVNSNSFKNCDFEEAVFLDSEIKEKINHLGGIVDFEDDHFMDENYRELILPWIKPISVSRYADTVKALSL